MTSAVLIFSMLPVALKLGEGGEGRAPLGAVLVGGMLTNTLLSLVYVPVAYTYFDGLGAWISRLSQRQPGRPGWRAGVQHMVDGRTTGAGRPDVPGQDTPPLRAGADDVPEEQDASAPAPAPSASAGEHGPEPAQAAGRRHR